MTANAVLSESLEDYLEAIFHIIAEKQAARAKDISRQLKVAGSSVTGALRSLAKKGLINYAPYDLITLTPAGRKAAKDVVRRHEALRDFFVNVLAVGYAEADEAACRIEHVISKNILERLIQFAEFVEICPRGGSKWIAGFGYHCDHGDTRENCEKCISLILEDLKRKKTGGKSMSIINLKDLKQGQRARVEKITARGDTNKRLVEMGVTPGAVIEVERLAPLGDPVEVKVKGYHLSLRKSEAEGIDVELI
ncbi:MAG: DtxR family transcriptional regulator [Deltaproteobacteria bacterium]|nr:DtxR family transcriptional regulator [Deltaproteobacteria bacterium]